MTKKDFISMILGAAGLMLFALGMCMVLLPEWNARTQGIMLGVAGAAAMLSTLLVRRAMEGKPLFSFDAKVVMRVALGLVGVLILGTGMCMVMVWSMLVPGILVGIVGILALLCLIPAFIGLKE
ncbi:MAG: hypothetical protein Q4F18_05460 [Clostridia bacterium]|nr:hypothetical protein [Clostridia bacterium]